MSLSEATPSSPPASPISLKIPPIIKRNTILLSSSQAFVGSGTQMIGSVAPILALQLTGMVSLGSLPLTITSGSRLLIAYPLGRLMDAFGRRTALVIGLSVGILGSLLLGVAPLLRSFPLLVVGSLIFGMGMAAAQQLRIAAADMYPRSRRAEGLGYVLSGSLVGALGAPLIVSLGELLSPATGVDAKAMPFFIVPLVIVVGIVLVLQMRPDPKEIAANLGKYYPGYQETTAEVPRVAVQAGADRSGADKWPYAKWVAIISSAGVQGNMIMMMAMMAVVLNGHGHGLPMISLSVSLHSIGMFGLTLPLGRLIDVVGRRTLMLVGLVGSAVGSVLIPASPDFWIITIGGFLVGAGWSCVYVAATAVIADTTAPLLRGRAIGTNDSIANGAGLVLGLAAGPLTDFLGLTALGVVAVAVVVVPMLMGFRLRELSPGKFAVA